MRSLVRALVVWLVVAAVPVQALAMPRMSAHCPMRAIGSAAAAHDPADAASDATEAMGAMHAMRPTDAMHATHVAGAEAAQAEHRHRHSAEPPVGHDDGTASHEGSNRPCADCALVASCAACGAVVAGHAGLAPGLDPGSRRGHAPANALPAVIFLTAGVERPPRPRLA